MDLPLDIVFSHILVQGGAFRCEIDEVSKYRYYFVLNQNPKTDNTILLVTATTQIDRHKSKFPTNVLVEIKLSEYHQLKQDSLVNCENAHAYSKMKLKEIITSGKFEILEPLPDSIMKKLLKGLAVCKNVPPIDKQLALGEED